MKSFLLFVSCICIGFGASAQTYFQKTFGDSLVIEQGQMVYQTASGSIYFFGSALEGIGGTSQVTMHKLAPNGQIIWKQIFTRTGNQFPLSMIFDNGIFVIVGENRNPTISNGNAFIMTIDTLGQALRYNEFGTLTENEALMSVQKTSDGGYITAGFVSAANGSGNDVLMLKFRTNLSIEWSATQPTLMNDVGQKAIELPNGNYFIACDQQQPTNNYNVYCQIYDANGIFLFDKVITSIYNGGSKNVILDSDSNIVIVGEMNNAASVTFDIYLVKLDVNTNLIWTTYITSHVDGDAGFGIIEPSPGNYVVSGYAYNPATQSQDAVLISTDTSGNVFNIKYYGGIGSEIVYTVFPSIYGGFLVSGFQYVGSDIQYYLIYDDLQLAVSTKEQGTNDMNLTLFPNPFSGKVFHLNRTVEEVTLRIFNVHGQLMEQSYLGEATDYYTFKNNLPDGNYFVNFQFKNYSKTILVLVE